MNKNQIAVFEELLKDENFKGKASLKHLLWLNTVKPKYEVGECFKVTDYGRRLNGKQVIDFNAKIVKAYSTRLEEEWYYALEMICKHGTSQSTVNIYKSESDLTVKASDNVNTL